jgi:hypothetical protein
LIAALYDALSLERLPATARDGSPLPDNQVELGTVRIP